MCGSRSRPRLADPGPLTPALQDVDRELPLQGPDRLAERRLGDVDLLGCPPERAQASHRGDVLELLDAHGRTAFGERPG